ncbi:MAG: PocR ligand-binding domain-containing protein, partial [Candidatus Fermentibacteria bacterium]
MKDNRKTKAQLIQEINELRSRVSNLESGSSAQSAFPADITGRKYLEKENEHRLISLTEPEFDLTNLSLTDVLDQRMLQSLQDAFSDAFNVPSVIFDIDGSFITRPSRFSDFCALLNSTNKGARKCTVFDKKMMETLKENPVPQLRQGCVLTNMVTGIVPIMLQGRHLANWGIGQMISGEIDPDEIRQYADEIDLDSGKLAAAAGHLLPVEPDVLKRTMDFLGTLSYQLSLLAWQNLQQRRNIAARDRAEKALISERKLYIAGPTIVFRWKAADGWPVEYVSPNVESVFGITDDEFMLEGILFSSIVHPDDIIRVGAEVEMYSRDNIDSFQQEYRIVRPDGKIRWLFDITVISRNDDGSISFYEGYVLDITHHKQAQFERERLMMAIEQVAETIVITNMDAEIEYVNPAFEQITGFSRDEAIGKNPRMLQSSEHGESFYTDMWDTLQRGQIWSGHIINKKKDSTLYTEEATISPVRNSSGEVVNYIAVKRDITSEINLERQLRQAQKMEAIGHLAGGVAHDFNNLLQVINGYTDLALAYIDLDHPSRDYVKEVEKAGVRARTLISQLLSFSRQQIINPVDLDLNDVIDKFMKMLTRVIGEHIQLKFIPDDDLGIIHADRGRME